MFEGFTTTLLPVGDSSVFLRHGGEGPPVLLLHGHPRTGSTWHRVAPRLVAAGFSVICPDLRGYGRSAKPAPAPDHAPHAKRAAAQDLLGAMTALGHDRFSLVGHDRGSYVALRLALDHPERVERLALLDCIPIVEHLERADATFATRWWHWFFYAQPDLPEQAIGADPGRWYGADPAAMGQENYDEWHRAVHDPAVVRGMLEDYRAGLTVDRQHEEADRTAGRSLPMPLLVLWSQRDDLEELYGDPLAIWSTWADDVQGYGIDSGHHMAEEAPEELAGELIGFFRQQRASRPSC